MTRFWPNGMPKVSWICNDCVVDLGGGFIDGHLATYHTDKCGVCRKEKTVTEPRDFRWTGCRNGECG